MYLGIDIGGTKTLVATLNSDGVILEKIKFHTPENYSDFIEELAACVDKLSTKKFVACGVALPGHLDRKNGIGTVMGNLPWKNVYVEDDVKKLLDCPVVIENDAKLAGLSEAMLLKDTYSRVVYITVSTGIGVGAIIDQKIDPFLMNAEAGKMPLEHGGKMVAWESFASGKAIVERYGKMASQITDRSTWKHIAHDLAIGLIDVIAIIQPEVIVVGGSVASYFEKFGDLLEEELKRYEVPLVPIPTIMPAARPEEAVVYGCYDLAKSEYGTTS